MVRFTHAPLQLVVPVPQTVPQAPLLHTWFTAHCLLQEPQFFGSLSTLVHWPLQVVCGKTQAQVLLRHGCPGPHLLLHAPQLVGSSRVSTHTPLHSFWVALHWVRHLPATHESPALQVRPQVPQLVLSLAVSTHEFPQRVRLPVQAATQRLAWHS